MIKGKDIIESVAADGIPNMEAIRESCIRQATSKSTYRRNLWVKHTAMVAVSFVLVFSMMFALPFVWNNGGGVLPPVCDTTQSSTSSGSGGTTPPPCNGCCNTNNTRFEDIRFVQLQNIQISNNQRDGWRYTGSIYLGNGVYISIYAMTREYLGDGYENVFLLPNECEECILCEIDGRCVFVRCRESENWKPELYLLVPSEALYNFSWFIPPWSWLGPDWEQTCDGLPMIFFQNNCNVAPISPENPFVFEWLHIGTFSHRGFSFIAEGGIILPYIINQVLDCNIYFELWTPFGQHRDGWHFTDFHICSDFSFSIHNIIQGGSIDDFEHKFLIDRVNCCYIDESGIAWCSICTNIFPPNFNLFVPNQTLYNFTWFRPPWRWIMPMEYDICDGLPRDIFFEADYISRDNPFLFEFWTYGGVDSLAFSFLDSYGVTHNFMIRDNLNCSIARNFSITRVSPERATGGASYVESWMLG